MNRPEILRKSMSPSSLRELDETLNKITSAAYSLERLSAQASNYNLEISSKLNYALSSIRKAEHQTREAGAV